MSMSQKMIGLFNNNHWYFPWYQNILYILAYLFSGEKGCLLFIQTRKQVNDSKRLYISSWCQSAMLEFY